MANQSVRLKEEQLRREEEKLREIELKVQREIQMKRQELLAKEDSLKVLEARLGTSSSYKSHGNANNGRSGTKCGPFSRGYPQLLDFIRLNLAQVFLNPCNVHTDVYYAKKKSNVAHEPSPSHPSILVLLLILRTLRGLITWRRYYLCAKLISIFDVYTRDGTVYSITWSLRENTDSIQSA